MSVHRKRAKRPRPTVSRVTQLGVLNIGGTGGGDEYLRQAARIIADGARSLAAVWSRKVPQMIYITADATTAVIHAYAPDARPAEFRLWHPLFGNRDHWYRPPGEKFLSPALDARIDPALRAYAKKIDAYAAKLGWK